jgi:hypothetical protein
MEFKHVFTRQEAESTLPLVRQIVADILETARKIRAAGESSDTLHRLEEDLREHLQEIEEIGCFYKDGNFSVGLVDFPAVIDGEIVFLCWRSDESELGWYHPMEDGFQGRRPLPKPSPVE